VATSIAMVTGTLFWQWAYTIFMELEGLIGIMLCLEAPPLRSDRSAGASCALDALIGGQVPRVTQALNTLTLQGTTR